MEPKARLSRRNFVAAAGAAAAAIPASARANPLARVNIVNTEGATGLALQELARTQGYFDRFGIAAEILNVLDASKTLGALYSGSSDLSVWSGFNGVLAAIAKGGRIRILAGSLLFPTQAVFSSRPDIRTVKDLKGKVIGVGAVGSQLHQVMIALFLKKGIDPASVTFRNVGSSPDVFRAIAAGTVDAGPSEADNMATAAQYGVHMLSDGKLWDAVPEFTFQASYADEDTVAKKRDLIVRALAAFCKTYRFVQSPESKNAFVQAYMKISGKTEPAEGLTQWGFIQKYRPYDVGLVLSPARVAFMQRMNVTLGAQRSVLPFDAVSDMSVARDAVKLVEAG